MEIGILLEIVKLIQEYGGLVLFAAAVIYFLYRSKISIKYDPSRKKE